MLKHPPFGKALQKKNGRCHFFRPIPFSRKEGDRLQLLISRHFLKRPKAGKNNMLGKLMKQTKYNYYFHLKKELPNHFLLGGFAKTFG